MSIQLSIRSLFILLLEAVFFLPAEAQESVPFIYYGHVFLVDATAQHVRRVGSLAPTAPAVAADPRGRLWGRWGKNTLAALDPATGAVTARVTLPHPVYTHVITPSGLAYVTHAALTGRGFTISVVDTGTVKLIREIDRIAGLRTDIVSAGETVFLAVAGTGHGDDGAIRLYEIDSARGPLREITRSADRRLTLRVAATGDRLFAAYIARSGQEGPARIEVRDRRSRVVRRTVNGSFWGRPWRLTGLAAVEADVFLFLESPGQGHEIAVADAGLTAVTARLPLSGPVARILAVHDHTIAYLDVPFETGHRNVNLCFYDTAGRREVKRISIPAWLAATDGPKKK